MSATNSSMQPAAGYPLAPETLGEYLVQRGLIRNPDQLVIRELGGGVSNIVLLVEGPQGRWVAKQSLGKLRVEDDWRSTRQRIFREAAAIEGLSPVLGDCIPRVIHVDRENFLYIMTAAPARSVMWKKLLLEGRVNLEIAATAGRLLAKMIHASRANPVFKERFRDQTVFDELRIDPYYRTTAERHPDAAEHLKQLIEDSSRIQTSLVHGDYSPKNMLMQDKRLFLIDFEVVHWGDPAFDAAFLLNHLMLKSFYRPRDAGLYLQAAQEFWQSLAGSLKETADGGFETMTVRHLGALMLARIDGKSPVEYIRDDGLKARVRKVAKQILVRAPQLLAEVFAQVEREVALQ